MAAAVKPWSLVAPPSVPSTCMPLTRSYTKALQLPSFRLADPMISPLLLICLASVASPPSEPSSIDLPCSKNIPRCTPRHLRSRRPPGQRHSCHRRQIRLPPAARCLGSGYRPRLRRRAGVEEKNSGSANDAFEDPFEVGRQVAGGAYTTALKYTCLLFAGEVVIALFSVLSAMPGGALVAP